LNLTPVASYNEASTNSGFEEDKNMKRMRLAGWWMALALAVHVVAAQAVVKKVEANPKGTELVSKLLAALSIEDEKARLAAVVPLMHKSLLTADGKDLDRNIKEFSYRKAVANVKFYAQPASIFEVHELAEQTIGFQETSERGIVFKYFVNKKEGEAGRPAPIHVFFPSSGGEPKLVNIGSL
jgi:hypothetical protein